MDVLADVIAQTRIGGVLFCQSCLSEGQGVGFEQSPVAGFHIMTRGQCWVVADELDEPVALCEGDVMLSPSGTPHQLMRDIHDPVVPWQSLEVIEHVDVRSTDPLFMCGAYLFDEAEHPHPIFSALPPFVFISSAKTSETIDATLALLVPELSRQAPGSRALVERLVDALLIYILRAWLDEQPLGETGWLGALQDPMIGPIVAQMHEGERWNWGMDDWSRAARMSRATFARRFRALLGESPMAYVNRLRLSQAGRVLRHSEDDLEAIAQSVGYSTAFSFSKAFKRQYGLAPGQYRKRHADSAAQELSG